MWCYGGIRPTLLLAVLALLLALAGAGECAQHRPFRERREGTALAELITAQEATSIQQHDFFFRHLHKDGDWPRLASYTEHIDDKALSALEAVRGILLVSNDSEPGQLKATTAAEVSDAERKPQAPVVTPYAQVLPFLALKQYVPSDVPLPTSTASHRESRFSAVRQWPYFFQYERFESLAAKHVHTQQLCGVVQLDRSSYGAEGYGVDEMLVLVYNDWDSHVERALALAEEFARHHLRMKDVRLDELDHSAQAALHSVLKSTSTVPALAAPTAGAFTTALEALTQDSTAGHFRRANRSESSTHVLPPDACLSPDGMLWVSVGHANAESTRQQTPLQIIAAVRQRQFFPLQSEWSLPRYRRFSFILDPARATPFFALVRNGAVSPLGLPITADTTLNALRRHVVQHSPSTFALRSADQLVRLVDHYGCVAVVLCGDDEARFTPWHTNFSQAFAALRTEVPLFGLHAEELTRFQWDRMEALPAQRLTLPPSAALLPDVTGWTMDKLRAVLGLPPVQSAPDTDQGDTDRAAPTEVCVRLVEAAVRHAGEPSAASTAHERRWRWKDVCVEGFAGDKGQEALWDRVLGAQLRDAVRDAAHAMVRAPEIRHGKDFRRTMHRLLRPTPSPAPDAEAFTSVVVVLDDGEGRCGDAARSSLYRGPPQPADGDDRGNELRIDWQIVVVAADAPALQDEISSAAHAAMARRQNTPPRIQALLDHVRARLWPNVSADCPFVLATSRGALYSFPAPAQLHRSTPERSVWSLEGPSRAALHHGLEKLESLVAVAPASHAAVEAFSSECTDIHTDGAPWTVVLPAGHGHPVLLRDLSAATTTTTAQATAPTTNVNVVALVDRSCGLCTNVVKSLLLLRHCGADVGELDLRDVQLQRRGASTLDALDDDVRNSPLLAAVRAHVRSHLSSLRPPQWFVANSTHVLKTFPSSGYIERNSWDVVVIEWMRLMGLSHDVADALHRCATARLAEEAEQRTRFRRALGKSSLAPAKKASSAKSRRRKKGALDDDDNGDL